MKTSETLTNSNNQLGLENYQLHYSELTQQRTSQLSLENQLLNEKQLEKLGLQERITYMYKLIEHAGKEPNIFEQYFFGKKAEAESIQEQKIAFSKGITKVLNSLCNSLTITLKQEEGLLGMKFCAAQIGTAEVLIRNLNQINERAINFLVDDYLETKTSIENKGENLGDELKTLLLKEAVDRLIVRRHEMYTGFNQLLNQFRNLIDNFVGAINDKKS